VYKKNEEQENVRVKKKILIYNRTMFSFLKKKPKNEVVRLVCLVTSYAVTAAVVKNYHKLGTVQQPVILFSCESIIPSRHTSNLVLLEVAVAEALRSVLNRCRTHTPMYDELICTIGEPWVMSTTRSAHLEKREAFSITQKLVNDLVAREKKLFEQEIVRTYADKEGVGLLQVSQPVIDANGLDVARMPNDVLAIAGTYLKSKISAKNLPTS
jgi:hypothetical protein